AKHRMLRKGDPMMGNATMGPTMMGMPGMMAGGMTMPMPGAQATVNPMMVPRCTIKMEKITGGMKMTCSCADKTAANMLQELCKSMAGCMCGCCCMMNGMMVCSCNLTMGFCKCEMTKDGVSITCTSGDKACCDMIQACCDCMTHLMQS